MDDDLAFFDAQMREHFDDRAARERASGCYRADTCVMDPTCPHHGNCEAVEGSD